MSKKNNLAKRKKQYEFDLKSTISPLFLLFPLFCRSSRSDLVLRLWWRCAGEKEAKEKQAKKLQAKKSKMKVPIPLLCCLPISLFNKQVLPAVCSLTCSRITDYWLVNVDCWLLASPDASVCETCTFRFTCYVQEFDFPVILPWSFLGPVSLFTTGYIIKTRGTKERIFSQAPAIGASHKLNMQQLVVWFCLKLAMIMSIWVSLLQL